MGLRQNLLLSQCISPETQLGVSRAECLLFSKIIRLFSILASSGNICDLGLSFLSWVLGISNYICYSRLISFTVSVITYHYKEQKRGAEVDDGVKVKCNNFLISP